MIRLVGLAIVVARLLMPAWGQQPTQAVSSPSPGGPIPLTLADALARARTNELQYRAALTQYAVAKEGRVQSRAALLPNVSYNAGFLYTQGNGTSTGRYVGANGVHEYISQGNVHQSISLQNVAEYRLARAEEALAKAQSEVATRGLVVTVVETYYGYVVAQRKYSTAQGATAEAQHFFDITQKLERGGEVAHSDTIKGQLQLQQQQRALQEAQLEMERTRLELAVLIFPNFNENFATVDDLESLQPLPSFEEVEARAGDHNPNLRIALAALSAANQEVAVAWNSFLPSVTADYFYGIDASHFAANGFDPASGMNVRNLGYAATATLELPIWNWGAGRSKVKSASLQRDQAKLELTFAQRRMVADLKGFYRESETARSQIEELRQSADLAEESLRLTTLRYQAGEATALEVVDAQNTLTSSQNALGDGELRFRVAVANLQTLTGQY
ncbi:MAG TPA: TolC family protein [Terriglobales bacterium]|jgi:outer membrane protein TolC|nr:TolC family protein [Terriglobales bacterium]